MTPDETKTRIPDRIGRYEIKTELGKGGMATVFLAHDPNFDRDVAVKVMPHALLHDDTFRARFDREAKVIAKLEHAAIVPVYDFGEEDGQPYLVMRYMPGGSLSDRLIDRSLTLDESLKIIEQLAPALDEAHRKGIVHRDLKPGNILFDQHGCAAIADFGIAKIAQESVALTGSTTIGTPAYMSPEQARGDSVIDGRSDIYSLGAILFQMLTGKLPYDADTPMGMAVRHITDPVPQILEANPELPTGCDVLIRKAMAKDPADRFADVEAMARALKAVASGESLADTIGVLPPGMSEDPETVRLDKVEAPPKSPGTATTAGADHTEMLERARTAINTAVGKIDKRKLKPIQIALLIGIGIILMIAARFVGHLLKPVVWPGYIILPGAIVVYLASREHNPKRQRMMAVVGMITTVSGLLLLYQAIFRHYASWAYAWALIVPGALGIASIQIGRWQNDAKRINRGISAVRIAAAIFVFFWFVFDVVINVATKPFAAVLWAPVFAGLGLYAFMRGKVHEAAGE
ncbi:MAG: serine/threonine protein kinase [Anaerolineae bacterium]|nr:serine/threonine protein kinase [Anaerolineae bacterium]